PISVKKPFPEKKEEKLKRAKKIVLSEKRKEEIEVRDQEEIAEEGEIMALAKPDDEQDEEEKSGED
ncbi:hypothetical protein KAT80_01740, partial [Candidatus Pacearchaeota archaeon]|nr:hypothetical protein [Candidatus Pacearchaeota archaeon]